MDGITIVFEEITSSLRHVIAYVVGNGAEFIFPGFAYAHQPEGRAYGDVEAVGHRRTFDDLRFIRMPRIVNDTSLSKKPFIDWMTGRVSGAG